MATRNYSWKTFENLKENARKEWLGVRDGFRNWFVAAA
jgi:hypothetical protein